MHQFDYRGTLRLLNDFTIHLTKTKIGDKLINN